MDYIRLGNTDFEGKNNIYVLEREDTVALVDTGVATSGVRSTFLSGLEEHGLAVEDVDLILLTHWHPDHVGLAGDIRQASGATVYMHADDAPLVRDRAWKQMQKGYERLFEEWGIPAPKRRELRERFHREDEVFSGSRVPVEPIADGAEITVGDLVLESMHLPGHTLGSIGFAFDGADGRELFAGDALLPVYTPNVGGADIRVDRPLERYLGTLGRIAEADFERAWPGHRDVIEDPTGRVAEIVSHHRDRTDRIHRSLATEGPADAWTVSARLFGELEDIHIIHGPGEAYAHLDHLERHGVLEREPETYRYRVVETDPDLDAMFPSVIG